MLTQQLVSNTLGLFRRGVNDARSTLSVEGVRSLYRVSLYRNTFYLLLHLGSSALLGFVFWIVVARLYSSENVGLNSAVISAASLIAMLSNLGLGYGLIRFLPNAGPQENSLVNSCFSLGALASVVAALVFLGGLSLWSPSLLFLRQSPLFVGAFTASAVAFNLMMMVGDTLVAHRRANLTLANSLIHGVLRFSLVVFLGIAFEAYVIFASWAAAVVCTLLAGVLLLLPRVQPNYRLWFTIDWRLTRNLLSFSAANYVGNMLLLAPGYVFPLIIINLIDRDANAYFYSAWLIGSLLFSVAGATSLSLFAEGSYQETQLAVHLRRSLKMAFVMLVPSVLVVLALADKLLLIFGPAYSENGTTLLRLLAVSALPQAVTHIFLSTKRVEKKLGTILGVSCFMAVSMLGVSVSLVPHLGINAVGVGALSTYGAVALVVIGLWPRTRLFRAQLVATPSTRNDA